jgi:hypothetical protein
MIFKAFGNQRPKATQNLAAMRSIDGVTSFSLSAQWQWASTVPGTVPYVLYVREYYKIFWGWGNKYVLIRMFPFHHRFPPILILDRPTPSAIHFVINYFSLELFIENYRIPGPVEVLKWQQDFHRRLTPKSCPWFRHCLKLKTMICMFKPLERKMRL